MLWVTTHPFVVCLSGCPVVGLPAWHLSQFHYQMCFDRSVINPISCLVEHDIQCHQTTNAHIHRSLKLKLFHYTPLRRLGGEEVQLLLILDLSNRWGWVISVTPRPSFAPGKGPLGTHCTGGWVGPRAGLDTKTTVKTLSPLPGIEPRSHGRPTRSQTLHWLSYPAHPSRGLYILIIIQFSVSSLWVTFESIRAHYVQVIETNANASKFLNTVSQAWSYWLVNKRYQVKKIETHMLS
jgi:hypothetical protein